MTRDCSGIETTTSISVPDLGRDESACSPCQLDERIFVEFRKVMEVAIRLPRAGVGYTSTLDQARLDASAADRQDWAEFFQEALRRTSSAVKADQKAVLSLREADCVKTWSRSVTGEDPTGIANVRRVRFKVLINALEGGRPIEPTVIQQIKRCLHAVAGKGEGEFDRLWAVESRIDNRFVSGWPEPEELFKLKHEAAAESVKQAPALAISHAQTSTPNPVAQASEAKELDPFAWLLRERQFVTPKEAAGVTDAWQCYSPTELAQSSHWLMAQLGRPATRNFAGTSLLGMFTHLPPRKLFELQVRQKFDPLQPLHIELHRGLMVDDNYLGRLTTTMLAG